MSIATIVLLNDFINEFVKTNSYIVSSIIPLTDEFIFHSYGLISLALGYILAFFSTLLIRLSEKTTSPTIIRLLLTASYILAISLCFTPAGIPFKALRFLFGLYNFSCFMTLHSRIMNILQAKKNDKSSDSSSSSSSSSSGSSGSSSKDSFYGDLMSTYLFNVRSRIKTDNSVRHTPTIARIIFWGTQTLLSDLAFYFMLEWIPENITQSNQYAATALISGIWILLSMSWNYSNYIVVMALGFDSSLPVDMRHCHPLLSTSISSFWGERWNPVIGKLLQESFYKPFRRLGIPRALCVICCFVGSSALHALPQFLSTRDLSDLAMMGGFFIIHGFLVLLEQAMVMVIGPKFILADNINSAKKEMPIVKAKYQWLAESLTVLFVVILFYNVTEKAAHSLLCLTLTFGLGASVFTLHVHSEIESKGQLFPSALRSLSIWLGWIFTLSTVIVTMPLFSMPVFHACSTVYKQSYVVGPLIRTLKQHNII